MTKEKKNMTDAMKKTGEKKVREPQFELLRIVAMLMVITLHYLGKGGLLGRPADSLILRGGVWYLEALCIVSVNIYVMISGYFMIDTKFHIRKLLILWCQVLFYSVGITLVCLLCGAVSLEDLKDLFTIQYYCLPVINQHYWFATAYILFYILSPVLSNGIRRLDQKQHGILLLLLLLFTSVVKSFLPVKVALDDSGYSMSWFLVLFVLSSYIRIYGIPFFAGKRIRSLLIYLVSTAGIVLCEAIFVRYGTPYTEGSEAVMMPFRYNFLLVVLSSVALFYFVKDAKIKENIVTRFLVRIAPYSFGVFLIHEHLLLRYRWLMWFGVGEVMPLSQRILHYLCVVLGIYLAGVLIDFLRARLFDVCEKLILWGWGIYMKHREIFDYLIVGFATTVVSWVVYAIFLNVLGSWEETPRVLVANAISWVVSVIFAYVTNRSFVFHSKKTGFGEVMKEFIAFTAARLFSFGVDEGTMFLLVSILHMNAIVAKVIDSVIVIVLNYVLSKLWIFKKTDTKEDGKEKADAEDRS